MQDTCKAVSRMLKDVQSSFREGKTFIELSLYLAMIETIKKRILKSGPERDKIGSPMSRLFL
jgi:hypothetical protein